MTRTGFFLGLAKGKEAQIGNALPRSQLIIGYYSRGAHCLDTVDFGRVMAHPIDDITLPTASEGTGGRWRIYWIITERVGSGKLVYRAFRTLATNRPTLIAGPWFPRDLDAAHVQKWATIKGVDLQGTVTYHPELGLVAPHVIAGDDPFILAQTSSDTR